MSMLLTHRRFHASACHPLEYRGTRWSRWEDSNLRSSLHRSAARPGCASPGDERSAGIEPASPVWKTGVSAEFTTTACVSVPLWNCQRTGAHAPTGGVEPTRPQFWRLRRFRSSSARERMEMKARRIEKAAHSGFPEGGSRDVTSVGHIGEPLPAWPARLAKPAQPEPCQETGMIAIAAPTRRRAIRLHMPYIPTSPGSMGQLSRTLPGIVNCFSVTNSGASMTEAPESWSRMCRRGRAVVHHRPAPSSIRRVRPCRGPSPPGR